MSLSERKIQFLTQNVAELEFLVCMLVKRIGSTATFAPEEITNATGSRIKVSANIDGNGFTVTVVEPKSLIQ